MLYVFCRDGHGLSVNDEPLDHVATSTASQVGDEPMTTTATSNRLRRRRWAHDHDRDEQPSSSAKMGP
jgi:hypothetical protein